MVDNRNVQCITMTRLSPPEHHKRSGPHRDLGGGHRLL